MTHAAGSRRRGAVRQPQFPAQIHDVKAAIRWLRASAATYAIDPERIGVVGFSAGAILALMAGLTGPKDGLEGEAASYEYSSEVQAVVSAGGAADLAARGFSGGAYSEDSMRRYLGGSPAEQPERYRLASPATYVQNSSNWPRLSKVSGR